MALKSYSFIKKKKGKKKKRKRMLSDLVTGGIGAILGVALVSQTADAVNAI